MNFVKWRGWLLILGIILIPPVLWLREATIVNSIYIFTNIGQLLGLVGMTAFAITLVLNTRLKIIEELFHGLDRMYFAHHMMGALTLSILLFHPLALVVAYLSISLDHGARFLIPGFDLPTDMGKIALTSMIVFLILTLFIKLPYHIWKFTHQFLGVSFIFASLHIVLISSDVTYNLPLRFFMFGVIFVGISSYAYRMVLHRFLLPKYWFRVTSLKKLNREINEIILTPESKNIKFIPGQFVFIRFKNKDIGNEQHPFSITSGKKTGTLSLAIKSLGDFTTKLQFLSSGDRAVVEGPYGKFASDTYTKPSVWIAGGIGITPFISLARNYNNYKPTFLFYSVKSPDEFIYQDELKEIAQNNNKLMPIFWDSGENGHLTVEQIKTEVGDLAKYSFYLCGPIKMMISTKNSLKKAGVEDNNIHYEEFALV